MFGQVSQSSIQAAAEGAKATQRSYGEFIKATKAKLVACGMDPVEVGQNITNAEWRREALTLCAAQQGQGRKLWIAAGLGIVLVGGGLAAAYFLSK